MSTTTTAPQPQPLVDLQAEYRFGRTDAMAFPARDGRPARTVKRAIHTVEIGDRSIDLSEELPEATDLNSWRPPCKKGARVSIALDIQPAKVLTIQNGKPQESKGLWRIRVLSIKPAP